MFYRIVILSPDVKKNVEKAHSITYNYCCIVSLAINVKTYYCEVIMSIDNSENEELELELEFEIEDADEEVDEIEEIEEIGVAFEVEEAQEVEVVDEVEVAEEVEAVAEVEETEQMEAVAEVEAVEESEAVAQTEVVEEPDIELDEESDIIIPDNKVGSYTEWRAREKRRSTIIMLACGIVAIVALVLLIILVPQLFDEDSKPVNEVDAGQTTTEEANSTIADIENVSTEVATEKPTVVDAVAPVITGVKDKTFAIGDVVMYLSGVTATDDVDGEVDVTVDKSSVNVNKAGSYKVKYTAVDKAGNSATAEATFTFKVVVAADATYQDMAKQLLVQIVDNSMSDGQKIRAIYDYIYKGGHMRYTQVRVPGGTWQQEAAVGLKEILTSGSTNGNCIMYASLSMALLEGVGAEVKYVDNKGSAADSPHVWVMCNVGTGWYHFDTTKYVRGGERFMCTDAQLQAWMKSTGFNRYYWDKSAYPATATENYTY